MRVGPREHRASSSRQHRRARVAGTAAALLVAPALLGGCSEVLGLASSGTLNEAILAGATVDALTSQQIPIKIKPVCTISSTNKADYTCTGTAATGEPIMTRVTDGQSSNKNPHMTITVGNTQVFNGEIVPVLDNAMVVTK